jgi:hypothetical protein
MPEFSGGPGRERRCPTCWREVLAALENESPQRAPTQLETAVLRRTDGCAAAGAPDRNDWITTCAAQEEVYPRIVQAGRLLKKLPASRPAACGGVAGPGKLPCSCGDTVTITRRPPPLTPW